jgi:hypothetical protein
VAPGSSDPLGWRDTRTVAAYACLAAAVTFVSVASLVARMPPVEPFAVIMVPAVIVGLLAFATVHGRALGAPELWRGAPTRHRILICATAAVLVASLALGGGASTSMAKVRDGRYVALQHTASSFACSASRNMRIYA